MPLVPARFLFRFAFPCRYLADIPRTDDDRLLDLGPEFQLESYSALDEVRTFADIKLAWNEMGLGVQVEVRGKEQPLQGDLARPRGSDGFTLWLDTRDVRNSHRASRYCHQFHFLAVGAGPGRDEPGFVQTKIHRALEDAPIASSMSVQYRLTSKAKGYILEAFLPATVLNGFDPEQYPRLGFFLTVRDDELGEQTLTVGPDFPFWEDPSLWSGLELVPR